MLEVVLVLMGVGIGIIISTITTHKKSVGVLRIDQSDPDDNPYLFLELKKDVNDVIKMDHVVLQVNVKNYISHK